MNSKIKSTNLIGSQSMFFRWTRIKSVALVLFLLLSTGAIQHGTFAQAQDEGPRDIISEDFLKNRPAKPKSIKTPKRPWGDYRLATIPTTQIDRSRLKVGLTIWRLESSAAGTGRHSGFGDDEGRLEWIPKRVEADTRFREGDSLRLSIESPRKGYLYVVNRDWLTDGSVGETNLIFPTQGEDNWLEAGKVIDIPAPDKLPFTATPKSNQSGELLTLIVTSEPLPLVLSRRPIPISTTQLSEWEKRWEAVADRFEMKGGAGQARTIEEQLAASSRGTRQLTREDPLPQTIYSLIPKNKDALLFNVMLFYFR